mgnify:CR=1 FL=1
MIDLYTMSNPNGKIRAILNHEGRAASGCIRHVPHSLPSRPQHPGRSERHDPQPHCGSFSPRNRREFMNLMRWSF